MVDSFDTSQTGSAALDGDPTPKSGLAGFMSTTAGKLVVGAIILVLVLVALGAIVFVYVFNAPEPESGIIIPGSNAATGSAEATIVVRPAPSLQDTFAFRNIFEPSVKPPAAVPAAGGDGTGGTGTDGTGGGGTGGQTTVDPADVPGDTIFLDSISTVDGVQRATLIWNGNVYLVTEGQQLEGTPWKLVRIEGNTAIMLYGDAMTTLTVGQGLTK